MYTETLDTAFLAIKLNFMLGLRVGELVALKWDDVTDSSYWFSKQSIYYRRLNLNTTLGYIYNPLTEKETYDLISKALKSVLCY
ncbi:MAG: hypothetical protein RSF83_09770, partial [Hungatella sp.]